MSDKKGPLVSVVITNYNYAQYVGEAIESVLNQTYKNLEIIVIDDGSTDDSLDEIDVYQSKIRIVARENRGVVYTRNEGISLAKGEFICFLDADDYLDRDYIEKTVNCAIKNKSDVVYTNFKKVGAETEVSSFHEYNLEELKNGNFIHVSSLIRRSALSGVRFDEELSGKTHEDWDFFLSMGVGGARMTICKNTFLNYRIHNAGRNNTMTLGAERLRYMSIYSYIIRKHIKAGHSGFDYLIGPIFADWCHSIYNDKQKLEVQKDEIIQQRDGQIAEILNSKSYKVGKVAVSPVRIIRKATRHTKSALGRNRH